MAGTGSAHLRDATSALLRVEDIVVEYRAAGGGVVQAVSGISLDLLEGETLGLVGESGCGKSSLGRSIMRLPPPAGGVVRFDGVDLASLPARSLRQIRLRMRMIFQDSRSALNPRRTVDRIVSEPLRIWRRATRAQQLAEARRMLDVVGLDPDMALERRPHQFSGGQCQRISIARALMLEPKLLICDEPVSSLDVSVQASILNLLEDLKDRYRLTMLFISHDLVVVKSISDRVAVMYLGKLCEVGRPDDLYSAPRHPYTRLLIDSIPHTSQAGATAVVAPSEPPSAASPPSGCRFRTRCQEARPLCATTEPTMEAVGNDHFVACHFPLEMSSA